MGFGITPHHHPHPHHTPCMNPGAYQWHQLPYGTTGYSGMMSGFNTTMLITGLMSIFTGGIFSGSWFSSSTSSSTATTTTTKTKTKRSQEKIDKDIASYNRIKNYAEEQGITDVSELKTLLSEKRTNLRGELDNAKKSELKAKNNVDLTFGNLKAVYNLNEEQESKLSVLFPGKNEDDKITAGEMKLAIEKIKNGSDTIKTLFANVNFMDGLHSSSQNAVEYVENLNQEIKNIAEDITNAGKLKSIDDIDTKLAELDEEEAAEGTTSSVSGSSSAPSGSGATRSDNLVPNIPQALTKEEAKELNKLERKIKHYDNHPREKVKHQEAYNNMISRRDELLAKQRTYDNYSTAESKEKYFARRLGLTDNGDGTWSKGDKIYKFDAKTNQFVPQTESVKPTKTDDNDNEEVEETIVPEADALAAVKDKDLEEIKAAAVEYGYDFDSEGTKSNEYPIFKKDSQYYMYDKSTGAMVQVYKCQTDMIYSRLPAAAYENAPSYDKAFHQQLKSIMDYKPADAKTTKDCWLPETITINGTTYTLKDEYKTQQQ